MLSKLKKANQANAQNKELSDAQASLQKIQLENQRLKIEKKAVRFQLKILILIIKQCLIY